MQFTLSVFLELCARRPLLSSICQKLSYLVAVLAVEKVTPNPAPVSQSMPLNVLALSNHELAQTLTMMEWESFTKIKSRHLLRHIWPSFGSEQGFISENIQHFNFISSW
jgi:hypothetical protein